MDLFFCSFRFCSEQDLFVTVSLAVNSSRCFDVVFLSLLECVCSR